LARGFAQDEEEMKTVYVVTRWYRAPEILVSCQTYDYKSMFVATFVQAHGATGMLLMN
jgi:serine/threonine protein kinase